MKATINRKTYDTSTADEIGSWRNKYTNYDFNFYSETLYRTKKGSFFLFGQGNAGSMYSESCGNNSMTGSSMIIPHDELDALNWCEEKELQGTIDLHFKHLIEEA